MKTRADPLAQIPSRPRFHVTEIQAPDLLGVAFVLVVVSGFLALVGIAAHHRSRLLQDAAHRRAVTVAEGLAAAIGSAGVEDEAALRRVFQGYCVQRQLDEAVWTGSDQVEVLRWPVQNGDASVATVPSSRAGRLITFDVPVRGQGGEALGNLRVRVAPGEVSVVDGELWTHSAAAGAVTLLIFGLLYRQYSRSLRPVTAIQQNLRSIANGVEQELRTLALSDSLGLMARGWNHLIQEVTALREHGANGNGDPAQVALQRFESRRLRTAMDRLPFGVLQIGPDQRIAYANMCAAQFLGKPVEALAGSTVEAAIDDPSLAQNIRQAAAGSAASVTVDRVRENSSHTTALRFVALPASDAAGVTDMLVTIQDVTHLHEAERARDNFLYHVTHELRTPLTNIHAYVETLTKPGFDDEQTRRECYNVITSETRRLSRLVEDILSVSQLEVGTARLDMGDVDLARLIRQTVQDNLGGAEEKGVDLRLELPPKLPKVNGDKQRLSVLFNNLIGNAVKYTPEGGRADVRVDVSDRSVRVIVSDTGIGIAADEQGRIFEKFYRSTAENVQQIKGTGLGLAIAREVARLHGGDIHVQSELGQGSTFTVELPRGGDA